MSTQKLLPNCVNIRHARLLPYCSEEPQCSQCPPSPTVQVAAIGHCSALPRPALTLV